METQTATKPKASSAHRVRRHRERRSAGLKMLHVEVPMEIVERLVDAGHLDPEDVRNQDEISRVIGEYLEIQFNL